MKDRLSKSEIIKAGKEMKYRTAESLTALLEQEGAPTVEDVTLAIAKMKAIDIVIGNLITVIEVRAKEEE